MLKKHPHALALLPMSGGMPSYITFDLSVTAVDDENSLRGSEMQRALRGTPAERAQRVSLWQWLRFDFGVNSGLSLKRNWGIGEGVEFSVVDATNGNVLWKAAPGLSDALSVGSACINVSSAKFVSLQVTASMVAAGAHAVFSDPLLLSGRFPMEMCQPSPIFRVDSSTIVKKAALTIEPKQVNSSHGTPLNKEKGKSATHGKNKRSAPEPIPGFATTKYIIREGTGAKRVEKHDTVTGLTTRNSRRCCFILFIIMHVLPCWCVQCMLLVS
jgi:hypothetical protein